MKLAALIRKGALREAATAIPATQAGREAGTVARIATAAVAKDHNAANDNTGPLPDPAAEARRQRVLELLAANPGARNAVVTDLDSDPDAVILALAIRGQAMCEFRIPRDRYDPFLLLDLIERHGGTVH